MSAMSDYLENKLIDHLFRAASLTKPATVYVALYTAAPSDAGGGTEVSGGGYARAAIATGDAAFNATQGGTSGNSSGTGGATANAAVVNFATPSASWGTVTHFGLFDALSGGNLLFHGALTQSKTINSGDAVSFAAGALGFTLA